MKANKVITALALFLMTLNTWAQESFKTTEQFRAYSHFLKDSVGIEIGIPSDFHIMPIMNGKEFFLDFKGKDWFWDARFGAGGIALSSNKDCMLVYPFEEMLSWSYSHHTPYLLNMMTLTKIYAQKAGAKEQTRIITDGKLCGGADSVIISEFKQPTKNYYYQDYQVTILMTKKGYLPMYFRLFFTEDGLKHKDKTIDEVIKSMKYIDDKGFEEKAKRAKNIYWPIDNFYKTHDYEKYFTETLDLYMKHRQQEKAENQASDK